MLGKNISLHLLEGTPTGIINAEIGQWTGKATIFNRSRLGDKLLREELNQIGIYILFGEDEEGRERLYLGQGVVWDRLRNHDVGREFWSRAVAFTSKDDRLTESHVRFLESHLIKLALAAGRVDVENRQRSEYDKLPKPDTDDMLYFLEQVKLLLPIIGFNFALPLVSITKTEVQREDALDINRESPVLQMIYKTATATGQEINGEFILFKDSTFCEETTRSFESQSKNKGSQNFRDKLLTSGKLSRDETNGTFRLTENVASPTTHVAACAIAGHGVQATVTWKVKDTGQTYGDWQKARLNEIT